jgi:uncharacterized delta-60 repeat protein
MSTTIESTSETAQPGRSPRVLRVVLRLLPAAVLLASQLAVAAPVQARPGDLDPSFGAGGTVTTDFPGVARALVVQGRNLVAAGLAGGETDEDFGLARYKSNGALDKSFGTGGKVTTNITGSSSPDEANALIQQADGKLVAAGRTLGPIGVFDFALVRYGPDGDLDPSFGIGGIVTTDIAGGSDNARALVQQADGRLVAAGGAFSIETSDDFALARYNPDGTLDPSFGTGGIVTTDIASNINEANALIRQADGTLVAAGFAIGPTGSFDFALARYNPDGTLDPSFGTGGTVTTDIAGGDDFARALAVQADGKLVAAGLAPTAMGLDFALARYNPDGTLDPDFGTGGKVTTDISGGDDLADALVVQAGGKLAAAGLAQGVGFASDFALARYNPDGTLDPSFGTGGTVTTDFAGSDDSAHALAVQADGKLVAAGFAIGPTGSFDFALARYRAR